MTNFFSRLIERQILKARAEGKLSGLEGEGKPLPDHPEAAYVDAATAAGFRMMADAGAMPEEIALKKQIAEAKARYRAAETEDSRKAAMRALADLELRYDIAREARRKFMG